MNMDLPKLSARSLSVGYSGRAIVDGIEINVFSGQITTLIGPNGAGKSTVLKTILRQLSPVSGTVEINGSDALCIGRREFSRMVSMVMTDRTDPELMTCREVIESGRYPYTGQLGVLSQKDKDAVNRAIEATGCQEFSEMDFRCLSDGQKQRVMLARAICQEPEILVLDEPTSFLDIRHKLELLTLLKELLGSMNMAVIMSLHELDLAQRISDKVVCIKDGHVDKCGTPEDVFTNGYIASLYGLDHGSFDCRYCSPEICNEKKPPEVFVIGGNGSGINIFRILNRKGIPFAAGMIPENDIDYPAAASLASELLFYPAFEDADKKAVERAIIIMDTCKKVICSRSTFGKYDIANRELFEYAQKKGYLCNSLIFPE